MGRKPPQLSLRAHRLYERIKQGHWYPAYDERTPAAMQELIDAGLVGVAGRVERIVAAYVPRHGYTPFKTERFK